MSEPRLSSRMPVAGKEMPSRNSPASSRRLMRLPRRMALRSGSSSSTARMSGWAARKLAASGGTSARFVAHWFPRGAILTNPGRRVDPATIPAACPESHSFILTVVCPDAVGIVAAVAGYLTAQQYFIEESTHFGDPDTGTFFMRTRFIPPASSRSRGAPSPPASAPSPTASAWTGTCTTRASCPASSSWSRSTTTASTTCCTATGPARSRMTIPAIVSNHMDLAGPGQLAQGAVLPRAGNRRTTRRQPKPA